MGSNFLLSSAKYRQLYCKRLHICWGIFSACISSSKTVCTAGHARRNSGHRYDLDRHALGTRLLACIERRIPGVSRSKHQDKGWCRFESASNDPRRCQGKHGRSAEKARLCDGAPPAPSTAGGARQPPELNRHHHRPAGVSHPRRSRGEDLSACRSAPGSRRAGRHRPAPPRPPAPLPPARQRPPAPARASAVRPPGAAPTCPRSPAPAPHVRARARARALRSSRLRPARGPAPALLTQPAPYAGPPAADRSASSAARHAARRRASCSAPFDACVSTDAHGSRAGQNLPANPASRAPPASHASRPPARPRLAPPARALLTQAAPGAEPPVAVKRCGTPQPRA